LHQNNYKTLKTLIKTAKNLNILANIEYIYFNDQTKLFSDLYLVKFLNISIKSFFPCKCDRHL